MAGTYNITAILIKILVRELNLRCRNTRTELSEDLGRSRNCFVRNKKKLQNLKVFEVVLHQKRYIHTEKSGHPRFSRDSGMAVACHWSSPDLDWNLTLPSLHFSACN